MKPHDFVGPFDGADHEMAINLAMTRYVQVTPKHMLIEFIVDAHEHVGLRFTDPAAFRLAIGILQNRGALDHGYAPRRA
jgi:hypothetical protein